MIRCIAIDMDGTLLNCSLKISKENSEAIKKAQELGIEVVITTGRSFPEALPLLEAAGIICPCICVNGAEIRDVNQNITGFNPIEKELAEQLYQIFLNEEIYVEFFTNKGIYTVNMEEEISIFEDLARLSQSENEAVMLRKHLKERSQFLKAVDSFDLFYKNDEYHIYKLLAFSTDQQKLDQAHQVLGKIENIAISSSGFNNIEINSLHAQKGIALEKFVKEKGISLMETMAIGDNYNDLSMFQRVGRSVAMGNADEEIKAQCDEVTSTNDESGVAKAILAVIKQRKPE